MKKFFVLLFLIIIFFPSCSTTEETVQDEVPVVIAEPEVVDVAEPEEAVVSDVVLETAVTVPAPEYEEPSPAVQETAVAAGEEAPISARDLVEQISETILQPEAPKEIAEVFPDVEPALPVQAELEAVEDVPVLPAATITTTTTVEEVPVHDEQPVSVPVKVADVLEEDLDLNYVMVIAVVISIVLLFTIASIIRNRFFQPLAKSISVVLALLFASIPLLVGVIITGWNTIYLLFLLLLSCYFVFRSKSGNINYR